jgi:hypothetical protein
MKLRPILAVRERTEAPFDLFLDYVLDRGILYWCKVFDCYFPLIEGIALVEEVVRALERAQMFCSKRRALVELWTGHEGEAIL